MDNKLLTPAPSDRNLKTIEIETKEVISLMQDVDNKFNDLPEGIPDSKSSDTEDLYARKEESVLKLKNTLKALSRHQKTINAIGQKHNQRLRIINKDKKTLKSNRAKKHYSFAEFMQGNKYQRVISCQKELNRVIEFATKAIKLANTKKFPGGNPRKKMQALLPQAPLQPQINIAPSPALPNMPISTPISHTAANQVNSLLALGPLSG